MITQKQRVLRHLQMYGTITQKEARELYGIDRLAARIHELRKKDGYVITSKQVIVPTRTGTAKVSKYFISPNLRMEDIKQ